MEDKSKSDNMGVCGLLAMLYVVVYLVSALGILSKAQTLAVFAISATTSMMYTYSLRQLLKRDA